MEISTVFKINDGKDKKLANAQICAKELSSVECSWHKKSPIVKVTMDSEGDLKWSINNCCCEALGNEIAKAIEGVTPQL